MHLISQIDWGDIKYKLEPSFNQAKDILPGHCTVQEMVSNSIYEEELNPFFNIKAQKKMFVQTVVF